MRCNRPGLLSSPTFSEAVSVKSLFIRSPLTLASQQTRLVTMSQEHHHHHRHHSNEDYQNQGSGETGFPGGGQTYGYVEQGSSAYNQGPAGNEDRADTRKEWRVEVESGLEAAAAGAYAHHEGREAREHPEHERRHKLEEEAAEAAAAGGVAYGVYEHEKRKDGKESEEASSMYEEPKKEHGWFHRNT